MKLKNLTGATGNTISFSASSAETYDGCPRRWWFAKVEGLVLPGDAGIPAAWGGGAHFALENYLIRGALPPVGLHTVPKSKTETEDVTVSQDILDRVRPSMNYLPLPGKGEVEAWIPEDITVWEDRDLGLKMSLKGRIDWNGRAPQDWTIPTLEQFRGLVIMDHKSKGSLSGQFGAKDEETLGHDRQGLLYAAALTIKSGHPPQDVAFAHNNIQRKGTIKTKLVATILPADRIESAWAKSQEVAAEMGALAQIRDQTCVPANTGYCYAFNTTCDFAARCKAFQNQNTSGGLLKAIRNAEVDSKMNLWEQFKQKKAETPAVLTAPPVVAPEEKGIQAPDAAPHDVTSRSQIEEVADTVRATPASNPEIGRTMGDIERALAAEGLHRDWRYNIALMIAPEGIAKTTRHEAERFAAYFDEYAVLAPLNRVSDTLSDEYRPAFRAETLVAVESDDVFAKLVKLVDHDTLLAARPKVQGKRLSLVDEVRAARGDGTPFDNTEEYRETLRSLWLKQRGGYEIMDEDIHESLKAHGYATARSKKRLAQVRALLEASKAVQTVRAEPAPVPVVADPNVPDGFVVIVHSETLAPKLDVSAAIAEATQAAVTETPEPKVSGVEISPEPVVSRVVVGEEVAELIRQQARAIVAGIRVVEAAIGTTLYVGCYTEGARPLHEMPLMKQAEAEVAAFTKGKADHWTLYKDYSDTGYRRLAAAITLLVARDGLPGGEWYFDPNRSTYRDVPIIETFQAAGAKIVQRMG